MKIRTLSAISLLIVTVPACLIACSSADDETPVLAGADAGHDAHVAKDSGPLPQVDAGPLPTNDAGHDAAAHDAAVDANHDGAVNDAAADANHDGAVNDAAADANHDGGANDAAVDANRDAAAHDGGADG